MATTPKAKVTFKTNPINFDDFLEVAQESPVSVFNEDSGHLQSYIIVYYDNKSSVDVQENYEIYLNESIKNYDNYISRYKTIKTYADQEVANGNHTGYRLFGYVLQPFEMQTLLLKNHHKKFQVKDKTYLNGPLKSNEFLAKKGKYYA
jgi:hypothetical protein